MASQTVMARDVSLGPGAAEPAALGKSLSGPRVSAAQSWVTGPELLATAVVIKAQGEEVCWSGGRGEAASVLR